MGAQHPSLGNVFVKEIGVRSSETKIVDKVEVAALLLVRAHNLCLDSEPDSSTIKEGFKSEEIWGREGDRGHSAEGNLKEGFGNQHTNSPTILLRVSINIPDMRAK